MNALRYLFHRYLLRSFAQEMQDRWCIDSVHHRKRGGFFVEFGAYDGVKFSNTVLLERQYRWQGICIEPHPIAFARLALNRRCRVLNCAVGSREDTLTLSDAALVSSLAGTEVEGRPRRSLRVHVRRLDQILTETNAPSTIDFMSVDVEGYEDEALLTFPFQRWRILALCIERPSAALNAKILAEGFRPMGAIDGLDSFFVHPEIRDAQEYERRPWTRLQYRVEAAIHRLEAWGVLTGDAGDWGHGA